MSFRISNATKFAWNETAFVMGVETRRELNVERKKIPEASR